MKTSLIASAGFALIGLFAVLASGQTKEQPSIHERLQKQHVVRVQPGEYVIDEPIVIRQNQILDLTGSTVRGALNSPLVILDGRHATLIGGHLIDQSTDGGPIVHVKNGLRFKIDGTQIDGDSSQTAIGIQVDSPIGAGQSQQTSYFGTIRDIEILNVDVGIFLTEQANGIHIANPLISAAKTAYFRLRGAYGNQVIGGFSHGGGHAGEGVIVFELLPQTIGKAHGSTNNSFLGHVAEPGNRSHGYVILPGCNDNHIFSQFNTAGVSRDSGKNNIVIKRGTAQNF